MTILNVYSIPQLEGETHEQYFERVTSMEINFNGDRNVLCDDCGEVKVDGEFVGLEPIGTFDDTPAPVEEAPAP